MKLKLNKFNILFEQILDQISVKQNTLNSCNICLTPFSDETKIYEVYVNQEEPLYLCLADALKVYRKNHKPPFKTVKVYGKADGRELTYCDKCGMFYSEEVQPNHPCNNCNDDNDDYYD